MRESAVLLHKAKPKVKSKFTTDRFDSTEPGRYDSQFRESLVQSEDEFSKEPMGLDQALLAGSRPGKKLQRKVSNLSILMSDGKI